MPNRINRRQLLRGAGSVCIGLPLLEEFAPVRAQPQGALPTRVLTLSFGLGIDSELQRQAFDGPLQPFQKIAPKAAFFSNLKNDSLKGNGTVHFNNAATLFTGRPQNGEAQAGGPSLEQIVRNHLHPSGVPTVGGLPSISAGIWSRTGAITQYTRHWNQDGSPGEAPERRPSKVFDRIFGSAAAQPPSTMNPAEPDPDFALQTRIKRSVLDSVKAEHDFLVGARSYLGAESKARLENHLATIRSVETGLVGGDQAVRPVEGGSCTVPESAGFTDPAAFSFYDAPSGAIGGPEVAHEAASQAFRLSADAIVAGLACDAVRFASMIFVGAGEHIRFRGTYSALGDSLDFTSAFKGSPHNEIFHNYVQSAVRVYQHYVISQLGYVLDRMDSVVEPNGKTLLDNTLVVVGTEYGLNHEGGNGIFGAVVGGAGKFRPGQYDGNHGFTDVYSTLMRAYGIENSGIEGTEIPGLVI
ncbi:MAG: hypothetical protein RJA70_2479 [Pseudomonadota bacterium]